MPLFTDRDPDVLAGPVGFIPDFSDVTTEGYSPLGKIQSRSAWSGSIQQVPRSLRTDRPTSVLRDYDTSALLPVDPRTYEAIGKFLEGLDSL